MTKSVPEAQKWLPYDPSWLVPLAEEQRPETSWLPSALARCTVHRRESAAYIYFVDPSHPNEPGSLWQMDRSIVLESPQEGELVLDLLKGDRVGGVEFISKLHLVS